MSDPLLQLFDLSKWFKMSCFVIFCYKNDHFDQNGLEKNITVL
jgi:hypothetical protein